MYLKKTENITSKLLIGFALLLISFKTDAAKGQSFPITDGNKSFDYARYVLFEDSVEFLDDAEFIRVLRQRVHFTCSHALSNSA